MLSGRPLSPGHGATGRCAIPARPDPRGRCRRFPLAGSRRGVHASARGSGGSDSHSAMFTQRIDCSRDIVFPKKKASPVVRSRTLADSRGSRHDNGVSRRASNGRRDAHAVDRPRQSHTHDNRFPQLTAARHGGWYCRLQGRRLEILFYRRRRGRVYAVGDVALLVIALVFFPRRRRRRRRCRDPENALVKAAAALVVARLNTHLGRYGCLGYGDSVRSTPPRNFAKTVNTCHTRRARERPGRAR